MAAEKNQSLERGLTILNLLDSAGEPLGVRQIARDIDVSPAIVQRLLGTLLEHGYVRQDSETQRYRIGYAAYSLGASMNAQDECVAVAETVLKRLASDMHLNGYLGVLDGSRLIYALSVQSEGPIAIRSKPGQACHFHSTAMGKAYLAALPQAEARRLIDASPRPKLTVHTIEDTDELMKELDRTRAAGFATALQENLYGVNSVGSAIRRADGRVEASLSFAFAPESIPGKSVEDIGKIAMEAAAEVSAHLGYRGAAYPSINGK